MSHEDKQGEDSTDDADYRTVLEATLRCALAWKPEVRLLGNVRAGDIARAITEALMLTRSSCAATLTAYVDELERRAREQKEWEGHPKYEGEYPSEVMQVIVNELRERFTLPESEARSCTCHPDDNPPRPCPQKFALSECRKAAAPAAPTPRTDAVCKCALGRQLERELAVMSELYAKEAHAKQVLQEYFSARSASAEHDRGPTHRWNIEERDGKVYICKGNHERSAGCDLVKYAPVSSTAAPEAVALAEQWKGRADDCGRLARAVLDAPLSAITQTKGI